MEVRKHVIVPGAEDAKPPRPKMIGTSPVALHAMVSPIHLDNQRRFKTAKVGYILVNGPLPSELVAIEAPPAEFLPQYLLGIGCLSSQTSRVRADCSADDPHGSRYQEEDPHPTMKRY